jgi:hypothetical protein
MPVDGALECCFKGLFKVACFKKTEGGLNCENFSWWKSLFAVLVVGGVAFLDWQGTFKGPHDVPEGVATASAGAGLWCIYAIAQACQGCGTRKPSLSAAKDYTKYDHLSSSLV